MKRIGFFTTLYGCALFGCSEAPPSPQAELGVFYGGQVQELQTVRLSSEPGKERYGFRVQLPASTLRAHAVHWEIQRPGRTAAGKWVPPQTEVGHEQLGLGEREFRKVFSFEAGAPTGTWNFRVLVDRQLVLDRALEVDEEGARPRSSKGRG